MTMNLAGLVSKPMTATLSFLVNSQKRWNAALQDAANGPDGYTADRAATDLVKFLDDAMGLWAAYLPGEPPKTLLFNFTVAEGKNGDQTLTVFTDVPTGAKADVTPLARVGATETIAAAATQD